MKKFLVTLPIVALLTVSTSVSAFAYQGDSETRSPQYSPETQEQMQEILENKDYQGWTELMEEHAGAPEILKSMTKERFEQVAEARMNKMELREKNQMKFAQKSGEQLQSGKMMDGKSRQNLSKKMKQSSQE